ncbi:MAG TPA: RNA polymerase sigma factor [Myxococcales bacterium]|nr:RNA polymerase sigma factor [Myxococcales bacterium]HIL01355.1 RNA polymerase sigma factor [Myxococcales bacterium]
MEKNSPPTLENGHLSICRGEIDAPWEGLPEDSELPNTDYCAQGPSTRRFVDKKSSITKSSDTNNIKSDDSNRSESERGTRSQAEPCVGRVATAELSDVELIAGVREASEAHFNELYNRYFRRIYGFVHGRLRNHADAEEVTQETFVTIFRSIENYRGQSSLLSWMFGIAKNLSNNMIRRSQNQKERFDSVSKEHFVPKPSLGQVAPDEDLSLRRYAEAIRSRMSKLPDWQCRIFEMRHLENMSIPEIASCSRRSNDAVRSSLYRIKKLIFEAVESGGEVLPR